MTLLLIAAITISYFVGIFVLAVFVGRMLEAASQRSALVESYLDWFEGGEEQ